MAADEKKTGTAGDVEAVITSYNQGEMLREAVRSVYDQTLRPAGIIIVDDGSADEESIRILKEIETDAGASVPVHVIRQEYRGVSAERNTGIRNTSSPMVLVLDGDDRLKPGYIGNSGLMRRASPHMAVGPA